METKEAVRALRALAHESRLQVFRLLVRAGEPGVAAGDIAAALDVPPPTLSFHLGQLEATGLIGARRDGRRIVYALTPETMQALLAYLSEDCCAGRPELCAPSAPPARKPDRRPRPARTRSG